MEVKIKIVVFKHPEPQTWGQYCGYCSSNGYFCSGKDASDISNKILGVLTFELQQRKKFPGHLQKRGWKICGNSMIPPNFADEELIRHAEESYVLKIKEPLIIELNVKIPRPKALL